MIEGSAMQVITMIRESADPEKAMKIALDFLTRLVAEESPDFVMASYGLKWEGTA